MGQGTVPSDWEGDYCCYSVMWPNSPQWLAVLRGVLALPATGRFWDENTGTITEAQSVIVETFDVNLHLEGVLMSCNDNTANALLAIANALANLDSRQQAAQCCDSPQVIVNNSIQTTVNQPVGGVDIPMYGSEPPIGLEPDTYPEGYDSLEEYDADKCRKATGIVMGVIQGLRNLSFITLFNTTALGGLVVLAIPGVIAFPPASIPVAIAAIIVLSIAMSTLSSAADYIEENQEDWICTLYQGDNVENTLGAIADLIDILISFISVSSAIGIAIKTILLLMFSSNTLNTLFSSVSKGYYPDAECNCDTCEDPIEKSWTFPTDAEGWEYALVSGGNPGEGQWYDPFNAVYIIVDSIAPTSTQRWRSPEGCYTGNKFQVSLQAQNSDFDVIVTGKVHYTDNTEDTSEFVSNSPTNPTNYDMDVNIEKNVLWVEVQWAYASIPGGYSFAYFLSNPTIYISA